jgi:hypothetical protein
VAEGSQCASLINTTPQHCAVGPWLNESGAAAKAGYGNFWPPECGPPGPPPEYLINTDNLCGCIDGPTDYYPDLDHFGCKVGKNDVSPVFEEYPWCYVQNGIACPAAVYAGPGKPALRQCSGSIQQTGQGNAMGDPCEGENCAYPKAADFLKAWAKAPVYQAFVDSGVLAKITAAGPMGGCDGPACPNYTLVLPAAAGQGSGEDLPEGADLQVLARNATGFGIAYAGEVYDGRTWNTLGTTVWTARLPNCPNAGPVSVYNHGFPSDAGGTSNVPVTPCLSVAPCISEIIYGEGIVFNGRRVQYWFITEEAIFYFTEG